ncbi:phenylpyruvate tautomerase PptA (4-oxalocrotonate tautomerase family) [Tardiphaga robiniae]|uniref:tautomerase family protein n=1 Tax=Tardiphaga robiniae TaxID=943830 RepID=UPI0028621022|nr:tautomerase family protein [Tardiphaga robiniae]MDR6661317.1 phenylpyruvate tautomerase PptA (4-oxalocrotonate tautomerase family) [Tardiphaga robiniae]
MPFYTVSTQAGTLSSSAKERLAGELTSFHSTYAGIARSWVHIIFQDYREGNGFTAGRRDAPVALTVTIRAGRSSEYKREMLSQLWAMMQAASGAPDDQIVIGIQEIPASQAMEMAQIMPDVAPA